MLDYRKNLLNELRLFVISDNQTEVTDETLCKAITLNENLQSLGYRMRPKDIIRVAGNESLDTFWDTFQLLINTEIKAKPMYPDYPKQVIDIDEAQFRMHQLCHYFSTYGIESLFGVEVKKGWLPEMEETKKTETDVALIPAKVIGLITESDKFVVPCRRILAKRERMSIPESEIVMYAIDRMVDKGEFTEEIASSLNVQFKENLIEIFRRVMDDYINPEYKIMILRSLCQHTGDVWKCLEFYIGKHKRYKLTTSEKKTIVKLFESYPVEDFRANLILSNKNARRIVTLLEFLSFNRFSRSKGHKKAVYDLRNSNLSSWNSTMRYLVDKKGKDTIEFIGARPGILLRMINELVRKGFDQEEIKKSLIEHADSLSMNTIVQVLTFFSMKNEDRDQNTVEAVRNILLAVIQSKLKGMETCIKGKKVFFDPGIIAPEYSVFNKTEEGGYIRSGMAVRIPEAIKALRFFCYWNDRRTVDIDLHAYGYDREGGRVHIGWNDEFRSRRSEKESYDAVFSGDITHSDAAEYLDINMDSEVIDFASFDISSYRRQPFSTIETIFTGIMAVNSLGQKVKLYDPKNCLFTHELRGNAVDMHYGYVDVPNRLMVIEATNAKRNLAGGSRERPELSKFTIKAYLDLLFAAQEVEIVDAPEKADIVLTITKPEAENGVSLIDENFFFEA